MKYSSFIKHFPEIAVFLAGSCLPLAFAPINFYLFALISPAVLLFFLEKISSYRAMIRGFLFGLGFFGVGVSWVFVSIHDYGNANIFLAGFFTLGFVAFLAIFPAVQTWILNYFFVDGAIKNLLGFPCSWLIVEWIRSWIFTGFPWLLIGFSQVNSPLSGYVPILGEYGTGFLLLFSSGLFVELLHYARRKQMARFIMGALVVALLWIAGALASHIHWTQPKGKVIRVALIQGNISQDLKWSEKQIIPILQSYYDLTKQHWDSSLIIWPEAAIPLPMPFAQRFVHQLSQKAKDHGVALIVGIPIQATNQFYYYNSVLALGEAQGRYDKRHLVPFGEYVPFEKILRGVMYFFNLPMSTMVSGVKAQANLHVLGIAIAPFICYEISYDEDLLRALPQAQALLVVSNDAWFGQSLAPAQHLQISQFRALQSGREALVVANNGITAIIDAQGQVTNALPQFQRAVLTGFLQPMEGLTPWARIGNVPFIVILILLWVGSAGLSFYRGRKMRLKRRDAYDA